MKIRALDENWDWTFGLSGQSYKTQENALKQNIKSRILSFYGDCFFDMSSGIKWFDLLDYRGEKQLEKDISNVILNTDGVLALNSVSVYKENRKLKIDYDVKTEFSRSSTDSLTNEFI